LTIILGDSAQVLKKFKTGSIQLTVTSPPYDDLRTYEGHSTFDLDTIVKELYRVTKTGGVVVWVIADQTVDFDESGTSFIHAQKFKKHGWRLNDTMIYAKKGNNSNTRPNHKRYIQNWEYMFVFCKKRINVFNPIMDHLNKSDGHKYRSHFRRKRDGRQVYQHALRSTAVFSMRSNIWKYDTGYLKLTKDISAYDHPAIFPEALAYDQIRSWSNIGDTVLDPFLGSGTVYKMALKLDRVPIGIEKNPNYIKIAKRRLKRYLNQKKEFGRLL